MSTRTKITDPNIVEAYRDAKAASERLAEHCLLPIGRDVASIEGWNSKHNDLSRDAAYARGRLMGILSTVIE